MNSSGQAVTAEAGREECAVASILIEVYFDFVCPWCLIGKRNLDRAVSRFATLRPDVQVNVSWRSHQLLPYTPLDGLPYQAFYVDRLGSPEAVAARRAQVCEAGQAVGIEFDFERIEVLPNTAAAHDLVGFAAASGTDAQCAMLVDRLFAAYFMEGENIGDYGTLERLGLQCGLQQGFKEHLEESRRMADPTGRRIQKAGPQLSGVPYFVFNTSYSLSGACSPDVMIRAMELIASR